MLQMEEEWKEKLTKKQYHILREKGTEMPFVGKYVHNKKKGIYVCAGCGNKLFYSEKKFDSVTGWPSFYEANKDAIELKDDYNHGIHRVEVICKKCGGHLGHIFDDAPNMPTGKRYCINSCALEFKEKKE